MFVKGLIEHDVITFAGSILWLMESLSPVAVEDPGRGLKTRTEMEREHLLSVLESTRWVIDGSKGAARLLEMHPDTLRYRMKKLNIRRPS